MVSAAVVTDRIGLIVTSLRTYLGMDLEDAAWHICEVVRTVDTATLNRAINCLDDAEQSRLDELLDRCDAIVEGFEEDFDLN